MSAGRVVRVWGIAVGALGIGALAYCKREGEIPIPNMEYRYSLKEAKDNFVKKGIDQSKYDKLVGKWKENMKFHYGCPKSVTITNARRELAILTQIDRLDGKEDGYPHWLAVDINYDDFFGYRKWVNEKMFSDPEQEVLNEMYRKMILSMRLLIQTEGSPMYLADKGVMVGGNAIWMYRWLKSKKKLADCINNQRARTQNPECKGIEDKFPKVVLKRLASAFTTPPQGKFVIQTKESKFQIPVRASSNKYFANCVVNDFNVAPIQIK